MKQVFTREELSMIIEGLQSKIQYYEEYDRWIDVDKCQRLIEKVDKMRKEGKK